MKNKYAIISIVITIILIAGGAFLIHKSRTVQVADSGQAPDLPDSHADQPGQFDETTMDALTLQSSAFADQGNIPAKYTCDGNSTIPPLAISGVPAEAKSLALIVHDPDAPVAGGFTHWVIWNIDPTATSIPEGTVPAGAMQGRNGSGSVGYTGPCPPSGMHHYQFLLYALDAKLDLPDTTTKADLEKVLPEHALDQTVLTGLYQRPAR
jgi:Raf kinase inhibitor-like YbhB/YbcL family protein